MKKIILCCILLCCCTLVKAQTTPDTLPKKTKQPMFMPNVGYSFETGRIGKVGLWFKVNKIIYCELAYSHFTFNLNKNMYNVTTANQNKFLFGVNYLPKSARNWFFNLGITYGTLKFYASQANSFGAQIVKQNYYTTGFRFSTNVGRLVYFNKQQKNIGSVIKVGFLYDKIPIAPTNNLLMAIIYLSPMRPNLECSIFYSF